MEEGSKNGRKEVRMEGRTEGTKTCQGRKKRKESNNGWKKEREEGSKNGKKERKKNKRCTSQLLKYFLIEGRMRFSQKWWCLISIWEIFLFFDANKVHWIELKVSERVEQLVRSSCGFGCWSWELAPLLHWISIMLTAMLQLCSWFRRWNISRAQRLLSAFILAAFLYSSTPPASFNQAHLQQARQDVHPLQLTPTQTLRGFRHAHVNAHTHTSSQTSDDLQYFHINTRLISCSVSG